MESSYYSNGNNRSDHPAGLQIIRHPSYHRFSLSWFDIRVFYVRIGNFMVDDSTPDCLILNHIPLSPDTVLEVNNVRCSMDSEGMSCILRRDRVDKKSVEATFITTDSIRITGSVKFQVFDRADLMISGVLETSGANGSVGESKNNVANKWVMKCEAVISSGAGFLKGKQIQRGEPVSPTVDVYVAGCFSGTPIILTKTLVICPSKKHRKGMLLHSIPENGDVPESQEDAASEHDLRVAEYKNYRSDSEEDVLYSEVAEYENYRSDSEEDVLFSEVAEYKNYRSDSKEEYDSLFWRQTTHYIEVEGEEDGELSWFNAGVRVGVGIGLGVCLGIGIGVGLLVRTYHTTTRTFKRRLL